MASGEPPKPAQGDIGGPSAPPAESGDVTERRPAAGEIADVSFPVSVRGYDRGAVDAYVGQVQHLVAELERTRSPEAAVKQALEQVGEQTKGILGQAGETAEQITAAARQEAEDATTRAKEQANSVVTAAKAEAAEILARSQADADATTTQAREKAAEHLQAARAEAAALREETEGRLRELEADTDTIRRERSSLLDDLHRLAGGVVEVARAANDRFPPGEASGRTEEGSPQAEATEEAAAEDTATETQPAEASAPRRSSA